MNKTETWCFGKKVPTNYLSKNNVSELILSANDHAHLVRRVDINCILDILESVADCWADPNYHLRKLAMKLLPGMIAFSPKMVDEGLNVVSMICRREGLEKRLSGELGSIKILDEWVKKTALGYDLKAVPRGVLLHLTAGNVFVGAVDSLVSGIITKNVNILKMSRIDPIFPALFIESIKENDPHGLIWPHQAALQWKGGDLSIERELLNAKLTVVFWGGMEALASVRSRIGMNARLVENGPRYSFAVIDGKTLNKGKNKELIEGLALDLSRWDQQACSSPHVVYVIDDKKSNAEQLMEELYDEMINLCEELPTGRLSFDEKVEIRKVRELAAMQQVKGLGRIMAPEKFEFSLIYEKDSEFRVSCLNRTLFFKSVKNVDELLMQVKPIGPFLQTVGLSLADDIKDICEEGLIELGAKRLTAIGGMSEGKDGAPHEGSFLLANLVDWVDREHSDSHQYMVKKLLNDVLASPYYNKLIRKVGGAEFHNFNKLPLLDRDTFYKNSPPESTNILTGSMKDAYVYASGGTTGNPKFTLYSNYEYKYVTDVLAEIYRNAGINENDVVANLFIAGNLWTSFNVAGRALENIGCLNLPIGGSSDIENVIKYFQIFKVNAVVGLPSVIVKLAEEIKARKAGIKIEKILYGGEHLRPQTCDFLTKAVGARLIRSAGYACVDTGPVGWQCLALEGSIHHVLDQYCYVEIINTETGLSCGVGEPGEIIVTNLNRTLMPVIRYKTGDMGRWVEINKCECGFKGKSFELLGRCDDLLVIGGINLLPVDVAAGLNTFDEISSNFQIEAQLKEGKEHLLIRVETTKKIAESKILKALKSNSYKIAESLSEGWMTVEILQLAPSKISRNKRTGKLKTVLDNR